MVVVFRADATAEIGTGHVMRCAALGMRLAAKGARVHFICAGLVGGLADLLRERGFGLSVLPAVQSLDWRSDLAATGGIVSGLGRVDLLVVDHYRIDRQWETGMRSRVGRILVIDDLADRDHDCDLLLDQNLRRNAGRYRGRIPEAAVQFLGPRYALLRPEFDDASLERERDGQVNRLLVFLGGTDPGRQTLKILDALRALGPAAPTSSVVLGPAYPDPRAVRQRAEGLPGIRVLDSSDRMSLLLSEADLAIGTCGVAAWERCALGVPCLVVVTAENQREDAELLHELGAVENLGDADAITVERWQKALRRALDEPDRVRAMAQAARAVMTGTRAALAEMEEALVDGTR